jgi:hypothetical protein
MGKKPAGRVALFAAMATLLTNPITSAWSLSGEGKEAKKREGICVADGNKISVAFKSNLLFVATGAPNLGVEVPLGERFSISTTGAFAYLHIDNNYALQTVQGGLDAKYWFNRKNNRRLTGWNAGVYGLVSGPWDVQWGSGWQGDRFFTAGLVAGCAVPVARRLNMEFALAGGWFYTPEARHYIRRGDHLMWLQTRRNVHRLSLTKIQIGLVWLIGSSKGEEESQ